MKNTITENLIIIERVDVMKKTFKITGIIIISLILVYFLYKHISIMRCEYLTDKYAHEYVDIVLDGCEPERLEKIKVLDYKDGYVRIYYVLDYYGTNEPGYGFIAEIKDGKRIRPDLQDTCVWSKYGNADEYIWPYGR